MREIKFRQPVFDKNGKFAYFHFWGYLCLGEFIGPITPYAPYSPGRSQQYTGLKDKNGKEAYEGDIYQFFDWQDHLQRREIEWAVNYGGDGETICGFAFPNDIYRNSEEDENWPEIEIIGNIYKNPELLKEIT